MLCLSQRHSDLDTITYLSLLPIILSFRLISTVLDDAQTEAFINIHCTLN